MDLSIIIVNWNSAEFLRNCLRSVFQDAPGISLEIIVVDNASYDGAERMLEREFPNVRYIQSGENSGFAKANNLGYEASTGRYLLFLNPDTEILSDALAQLVACLDSLPDAGALGCRLLNGDGTLQTSCVQAFPTILNQTFDSEALRDRYPNSKLWGMEPLFRKGRSPRPVEMISGAALLVRRTVFEKVGLFSTDYFMYGEDADLSYKIAVAGWKLYYLPAAQIIHYGGQSTKKKAESSFSTLLMQESLCRYFVKNNGLFYGVLFRISRCFSALVRLALLTVAYLRPAGPEEKAARNASARKWTVILRWSLGLQKWNAPSSRPNKLESSSSEELPPKSRSTIETL